MNTSKIKLEFKDKYAIINLNNPTKKNAIDSEMWDELNGSVINEIEKKINQNELRLIIVKGIEKSNFSAGSDILEFIEIRKSSKTIRAYNEKVGEVLNKFYNIPIPTIAVVRGPCMGAGLAFALSCDLRYFNEDVTFGIQAAKLAISAEVLWIKRIVDVVGQTAAANLLLRAEVFDVKYAEKIGLATEVFSNEDFEKKIEERINGILKLAPISLSAAKITLNECLKFEEHKNWEKVKKVIQKCDNSKDYQEAVESFKSKTIPNFKGL